MKRQAAKNRVNPRFGKASKQPAGDLQVCFPFPAWQTFCRRDLLPTRLFADATFCRRDFLPTRLFADATFCRRDFLPTRLFADAKRSESIYPFPSVTVLPSTETRNPAGSASFCNSCSVETSLTETETRFLRSASETSGDN